MPELPAAEREAILREHFRSVGIGIFETAISWWSSDARIRKLTRLEGEEHLQAALARGRGAILLSAHFTTLEIGARALCARVAASIMYRPTSNAVLERFLMRNRGLAGEARDSARRRPHADRRAEEQRTGVVCARSELPQERRGDGAVLQHSGRHEHRDFASGAHDRRGGAALLPGTLARLARLSHGHPARCWTDFPTDDPAARCASASTS